MNIFLGILVLAITLILLFLSGPPWGMR